MLEAASLVLSYCGPAPFPGELSRSWNFDPLLLTALLVVGIVLSGANRIGLVTFQNKTALTVGVLALLVAFVSPICALASALFSARALHHIVLVSAAAPLLAFALTGRSFSIGAGVITALLHAIVFWAWHAPAAYEAALSSFAVYWMMQISILGSALLLWSVVLRSRPLAGIGLALASMMQMGLLGALLAFSRQAIYTPHFGSTAPWSLTPLEDQQLAGVLMWVLGGLSFFVAALWQGHRLLTRPQPAC